MTVIKRLLENTTPVQWAVLVAAVLCTATLLQWLFL